MYIHVIFNPNQVKKPQGNKVVQYFKILNSVIFHKTEVLTVILRCLMGLHLDWVKSYGLRCSLRLHASSANSQKIASDK